jgi:hypothetical protein
VFCLFVELGFIPCTRNTADETLAADIAEGAGNICQRSKLARLLNAYAGDSTRHHALMHRMVTKCIQHHYGENSKNATLINH